MIRPLAWVGSSRKDHAEFPERVQDDIGYRLYCLQVGGSVFPPAKALNRGVLKGLGIYELGEDYDGDTYRAVNTVKLNGVVYVLHAFKKKSTSGIATSKHHVDLIRARFHDAVQAHARLLATDAAAARNYTSEAHVSDEPPVVEFSSGNLWADIGRPDADAALARAELMSRVTDIIRERRLTQARAAEILGTNQPTISDLMRGKMSKFALERLIAFLNALDRDVEITVRRRPEGTTRAARFVVTSD